MANEHSQVAGTPREPSSLMIKGGHVLDSSTMEFYVADILVRGETIVRIGKVRPPRGAAVLDARGYYVVPGLIDVHVHLFGSGMSAYRRGMPPPLATAMVNCKHLLRYGVTTVRSAGEWGDDPTPDLAINAQRHNWSFLCPRIVPAGKACDPSEDAVRDKTTLRQMIDEKVKSGAQWLKLMLGEEDRDIRPLLPWLQNHLRRKGLYSMCHAQIPWTDEVIAAGMNSIEHTFYMTHKSVESLGPHQFLVPTIVASEGESVEATRWAWQLSKRIGVGSDAAIPGLPFAAALWKEMDTLMKCLGVSPMEVFRLATAENAKLLRLPKVGTLREGHAADLLLLRKHMKHDLDALLDPWAVICRGQFAHAASPGSNHSMF